MCIRRRSYGKARVDARKVYCILLRGMVHTVARHGAQLSASSRCWRCPCALPQEPKYTGMVPAPPARALSYVAPALALALAHALAEATVAHSALAFSVQHGWEQSHGCGCLAYPPPPPSWGGGSARTRLSYCWADNADNADDADNADNADSPAFYVDAFPRQGSKWRT